MITPSFGLTATERVLPKLTLDFTTASLDSRITFTRSGATATRVNASGYIETVAADTARFDFDPVTLACKGLLVEETRANLQRYSTINNANWNTLRANIVDNQIVSPLGTTTAPKVECNTTGGGMNVNGLQCTIGSGATITASVYLKKGYDNFTLLIVADATTSNGVRQWVNINTGVLGSTSTFGSGWAKVGATVSNAGNGWYRVTFTVSTTGTTAGFLIFPSCPADGNASCTAGVTFGYPWGAQVEEGAFATSYIPTAASAVTRNADVATMTGTNFSSWFNASEGTFVANFETWNVSGSNRGICQVDDGSNNNAYRIFLSDGSYTYLVRAAGVTNKQYLFGATTGPHSICGTYKNLSSASAFDGGATQTDATAIPVATMTTFNIGGLSGGFYGNLWLASLNYYPQRVTNNEVQAFSK